LQVASWFARRDVKLVLDVTDEQRSRRPIFIATLWAGASWPFFRVARSTRMTHIRALRSRLEKQPTDLRQKACYFGDRTLVEALCQSWADTNRRALFLIGLSLLFAALAISELPQPLYQWVVSAV
jgi:hypothetical protein